MTPAEDETTIAAGGPKTCAKCQQAEAGPGGILCAPCKTDLESRTVTDWYGEVAP